MKYFVKPGWKLNPNEKIVQGITKAVERCDGECPCNNPGPTRESRICPCDEYMINDHCCCGLYLKDCTL